MNDLSQITWQGYGRKDGSTGIRNKVLVVYTVECAKFVAEEIARQCGDDDVEVIGFFGCTDNEYALRLLLALIRHPNVGGIVAVGLGCEYIQAYRLAEAAQTSDREAVHLLIQEIGGTAKTITKGIEKVKTIQKRLQDTSRIPMSFKDLVIGAECGGSDFTSGLAGNVIVGAFFDRLVELGGKAIFEEIVEAVGLKELLCGRAADKEAQDALATTYDKAMAYCLKVGQYSVSPGNFAGGLSTIEEKSMGALIKSGSQPIQGVLKVGQKSPEKGLWLLDTTPDPHTFDFGITNPNDNEGLTALAASGCHLLFLVTGRGNVVGQAVSPVVKITGNSDTFKRMPDDMDFDAGTLLTGAATQDELLDKLFNLIQAVAGGQKAKAEILGHKEYCIPYKYQHGAQKTPCCK